MKILIAYDGVNPIEKTIQDLERAGLPKKVEALVFTAGEPALTRNYAPAFSVPEVMVRPVQETREAAQARIDEALAHCEGLAVRAAKDLRETFPNWSVQSEAWLDSGSSAILKKADGWSPDLIVLGSHSASPVAKFFLGSVAHSVLIHSHGSVRIVRDAKKTAGPIRLVIGVDGSSDSEKAVAAVTQRAWPSGTLTKLVTAFDLRMSAMMSFSTCGEKEWVDSVFQPCVSKLRTVGLEVSQVIEAGDPKHLLLKEAEDWKADCIFVGARGLGAVDRLLLGSVSSAVASRAHCSVEVVRR